MAKWQVQVFWPGSTTAIESRIPCTDVQISDGGVLRMYRDEQVVAVYGPGFWVSAAPVED